MEQTIQKKRLKPWKKLGLMRPDIRKMIANTKDDHLRDEDHSDEVSGWEDDSNVVIDADLNDQITIVQNGSLDQPGVSSVGTLGLLPSEAFQKIVVAADLTREQMMEVCRITKPAGLIMRGL